MRTRTKDCAPVAAIRVLALIAAIAATVAVLADAATAQSGNEKLASTEIGVSDTEIHIAVMADVDNSIAPNVLLGARDAVEGFAKFINSSCATKSKCLAGRKLVVDSYDSHLTAVDANNGQIEACTNDFAMVGTAALFVKSVDEMRNCRDHAGATTGIPEIPVITSALDQQCSDESFPILPPTIRCATKDRHPQTYVANVGRGYYFIKKYGDIHGVYVFSNDTQIGHALQVGSGFGGIRDVGGVNKGVRSDADITIGAIDAQRQDALTPAVQAMKTHDSNYAQCAIEYQCTVSLRKEADVQGVNNQVKVWDCNGCYSKQFLQDGGADADGTYVDNLFLPFYDPKEAKANPMLANFVRYTGEDNVDFAGAYAWGAAVAFREAVKATVKAHGVNGLTRVNLLAALNNIHEFDADGMLAPIDLASRTTTDCHVLTQVRNGTFVRVEPTKPGTFDCNPKYIITRKLNLLLGS